MSAFLLSNDFYHDMYEFLEQAPKATSEGIRTQLGTTLANSNKNTSFDGQGIDVSKMNNYEFVSLLKEINVENIEKYYGEKRGKDMLAVSDEPIDRKISEDLPISSKQFVADLKAWKYESSDYLSREFNNDIDKSIHDTANQKLSIDTNRHSILDDTFFAVSRSEDQLSGERLALAQLQDGQAMQFDDQRSIKYLRPYDSDFSYFKKEYPADLNGEEGIVVTDKNGNTKGFPLSKGVDRDYLSKTGFDNVLAEYAKVHSPNEIDALARSYQKFEDNKIKEIPYDSKKENEKEIVEKWLDVNGESFTSAKYGRYVYVNEQDNLQVDNISGESTEYPLTLKGAEQLEYYEDFKHNITKSGYKDIERFEPDPIVERDNQIKNGKVANLSKSVAKFNQEATSSPEALEAAVNQTGDLLNYGRGNRALIMQSGVEGRYFATKETFEKSGYSNKKLDFNVLNSIDVFKRDPVSDGEPVKYSVEKLYSATEVTKFQTGTPLSNVEQEKTAGRSKIIGNSKDTRLNAVNNAFTEMRVPKLTDQNDSTKALQTRMTRYMVRDYAYLSNKPFKFNENEKALVSTMNKSELNDLYRKSSNLAAKVSKQVDRNLKFAKPREQTKVQAQQQIKSQQIAKSQPKR